MSQRAIEGLGMKLMRAWMWLVPIVMLAASALFGYVAAADGKWGLLAVMVVMGFLGLALLTLHWWLLYRFGAAGQRGSR